MPTLHLIHFPIFVIDRHFIVMKISEYTCFRDAEIRIFKVNLVNTMDDDALAPCVDRSPAAMVLCMINKPLFCLRTILTKCGISARNYKKS